MTASVYDAVVVGAGSVGMPTAMYLAEKGLKVLCVDQFASAGQGSNKAAIGGLDKPGDKVRLRLALVEDWVRYRGGNGLPYHHRVVRALPGGAKGRPVAAGDSTQTATVNVAELRLSLNKYLDDLVQNGALFANPQRPMRFRDLHVVAFVQNDDTREILQAVETKVQED